MARFFLRIVAGAGKGTIVALPENAPLVIGRKHGGTTGFFSPLARGFPCNPTDPTADRGQPTAATSPYFPSAFSPTSPTSFPTPYPVDGQGDGREKLGKGKIGKACLSRSPERSEGEAEGSACTDPSPDTERGDHQPTKVGLARVAVISIARRGSRLTSWGAV